MSGAAGSEGDPWPAMRALALDGARDGTTFFGMIDLDLRHIAVGLALTLASSEARGGNLLVRWDGPHPCPASARVTAAVQSRLRGVQLREDLRVTASAASVGRGWRLTLDLRRGAVSVRSTHEASACNVLATIAVSLALREAALLADGPVDAAPPFVEVLGATPVAPYSRFYCNDLDICTGTSFGAAIGTVGLWSFARRRELADRPQLQLDASLWFSDRWAVGIIAIVGRNPGVGLEVRVARRLVGASPLDSGARAIALLGAGSYPYDVQATQEGQRAGLRPALRVEASLGPLVAWAELGTVVTPTFVALDGFVGIGGRILDAPATPSDTSPPP